MSAALRALASGLWVAERPLGNPLVEIGTRMTVIRLRDGGLFLHSPVKLDPELRAALDALGPVRAIVCPIPRTTCSRVTTSARIRTRGSTALRTSRPNGGT